MRVNRAVVEIGGAISGRSRGWCIPLWAVQRPYSQQHNAQSESRSSSAAGDPREPKPNESDPVLRYRRGLSRVQRSPVQVGWSDPYFREIHGRKTTMPSCAKRMSRYMQGSAHWHTNLLRARGALMPASCGCYPNRYPERLQDKVRPHLSAWKTWCRKRDSNPRPHHYE